MQIRQKDTQLEMPSEKYMSTETHSYPLDSSEDIISLRRGTCQYRNNASERMANRPTHSPP